ncbi:carboxypeptidase B-like [Schistocerca americana]|uniref:carboxypeptidase B-like n=1 Tax=Schistocerca americana TaxID=7009 RepID=UPI001F4FEEE4|nr:carboxypeptidase B-like [Schistocerca americana]
MRRPPPPLVLMTALLLGAAQESPRGGPLSVLSALVEYFKTGLRVVVGAAVGARWQVLRATAPTQDAADQLESMLNELEEDGAAAIWADVASNRSADFAVSPDILEDVKDFLEEHAIPHTVMIPDLQKAIMAQNPRLSKQQRKELRTIQGHDFTFRRYHRYADILRYLSYLSSAYPSLVEVLTIGHSWEGLPLKLARVSTGGTISKDGRPKPAVWIDAGGHGREWVSPAVALFVLRQLVENYQVNRRVVDAAEWFVLPVANPDGYEYSHTTDRLWRKTRSTHTSAAARYVPSAPAANVPRCNVLRVTQRPLPMRSMQPALRPYRCLLCNPHYVLTRIDIQTGHRWLWRQCAGADLNRNWGFHWGGAGASRDPCSERFAGPRAFSEPEARAAADFLTDRAGRVRLFLSLHAYSQAWLAPWGHSRRPPPDAQDLMDVARLAVEAAARVTGQPYRMGHARDLAAPRAGCSEDWAKGVAGIKYAYAVELRDRGDFGFLLPASQIISTGRETFAAIKAAVRAVIARM